MCLKKKKKRKSDLWIILKYFELVFVFHLVYSFSCYQAVQPNSECELLSLCIVSTTLIFVLLLDQLTGRITQEHGSKYSTHK